MSVRHLGVLAVGCLCAGALAGNLNPPAGPVAPTMLSLDKIETRVCLNDLPGSATARHVISQPGNYFLSGDIVAGSDMNGVEINLVPGATGTVSVDLNGNNVSGGGGAIGGGFKGGPGNVTLQIRASQPSTVSGFPEHGVSLTGFDRVFVSDVTLADCGGDGVRVDGALECLIDVSVRDCFGNGVTAQGVAALRMKGDFTRNNFPDKVRHRASASSRITNVGGHGVLATDCDDVVVSGLDINSTGFDGIRVEYPNPGPDASVDVSSCMISRSLVNGITVLAGPRHVRAKIRDPLILDTTGDGLFVQDVEHIEVCSLGTEDCDGDSFRYHGTTPGHKYIDTLTLRSANAGGDGVHIEDHPLADSTILLRDIVVDGAAGSGMLVRAPRGRIDAVTNQLNSKIERCASNGVDIECDSLLIGGLTSSANGGAGARLVVAGALDVRGGLFENNGAEGMVAIGGGLSAGKASMSDLSFVRNGFGGAGLPGDGLLVSSFSSVRIRAADSFGNSGTGVRVADFDRDGRLDLVKCSGNLGNGISIESPSGIGNGRVVASQCVADSNQGNGVFLEATTGGQVVDCTMSSNGALGLQVIGFGHVVHRNALIGNIGGPMLVPAGNVVGPVVDELTIPVNSNPAANYVH